MKKYTLPALFLFATIASPLTLSADAFNLLQGGWNCTAEGVPSRLEFQSPNRLVYNGTPAAYQINGTMMNVEEEGGVAVYYLGLEGGTLSILSMDGSVTKCQRGAAPKQPAHAAPAPKGQTYGSGWPPPYVRPPGRSSWESSSPQHLLYKFAGRWDHYSGSTLINLYLKPDGTYEDSSETSYSGEFHDQGGYQTGHWGAVGTGQGGGRWTIVGTLR